MLTRDFHGPDGLSNADDNSDEPDLEAHLDALGEPDHSLESLVADFLDVVDDADAAEELNLDSVMEMLRDAIDADPTDDDLWAIVEDKRDGSEE